MLMCTHPCSTHHPPFPRLSALQPLLGRRWNCGRRLPGIPRLRRVLGVGSSNPPVGCLWRPRLSTFLFRTLIYCKDYVDVLDIWCNRLLFPFLILFEHYVMMSMLCNCCVREFLILARTWFTFGLPSKIGCDTSSQQKRALSKASLASDDSWLSLLCRVSHTTEGEYVH
jgi:hypothetical protein